MRTDHLHAMNDRLDAWLAETDEAIEIAAHELSRLQRLRDHLGRARVPFFGKQLGPTVVMSRTDCVQPVALGAGWRAHHAGAPEGTVSLRDRRGADPIEWPPELRRREFPREHAHG